MHDNNLLRKKCYTLSHSVEEPIDNPVGKVQFLIYLI